MTVSFSCNQEGLLIKKLSIRMEAAQNLISFDRVTMYTTVIQSGLLLKYIHNDSMSKPGFCL